MPDKTERAPGYDAIVMAGDRGAYKPVYHENKAFLEIDGVPVLLYVLCALQKSRHVARVFVVGPADRITRVLEQHRERLDPAQEIHVVPQVDTMLQNALKAFYATLPAEAQEGMPGYRKARARFEDKAVLILGADIPLVTAAELDEFVERSDLSRFDYVLGMTREEALRAYYPLSGQPFSGIRFAYFCFHESRERQNNLHMVRVLRVFNRDLIQTVYRLRYQQRWRNILGLGWRLLRRSEVRLSVLAKFFLLQVCRVLDQRSEWRLKAMQRFFRRFLVKEAIQQDLSRVLKARLGSAVTSLGGATLDLDNERDYQVIKRRYGEWMDHQRALIEARDAAKEPGAGRGTE